MAFGKKKNKPAEIVTPEEVAKLGAKNELAAAKDRKSSVYDHFHAQENAKEIEAARRRKRRYAAILSSLLAILLIIYIISMLTTQWGDLVISVGDMDDGKTILLSESADFSNGAVKLDGGNVKEVTNITKAWLPKNLDTAQDGKHNGKNYLAYTFYLKNTGDVDLDYNTEMTVTGKSKSADEAVRIMIYRNGEEAVYAKGKFKDRKTAETDATKWKDNDTILSVPKTPLKAKAQDKYTVVIWIEGNDAECVDAIRGGHIRSQLTFNVNQDKD